jgi:hypothetical protein
MFGNREVCMALSSAAMIQLLVQIMPVIVMFCQAGGR